MAELRELKRLTIIDLVDNETDGLSSPCACMQPIPNNSKGGDGNDERAATYTQETATGLVRDEALDIEKLCHAAHGL
eukprot:CAMPEP_0197251312 /NCGR_PEP_ID=MMETSP1429-20130617/56707_1 /TAXON_ID=49237 /ORGANISM="Chaetoceros  sp., Strain UNC1202" /LENGTH=76 /DNA_ID=CAMNT_0042713353 /DNA_START=11 /DNA_END=238 /DNA_ORIENTATION=-